MHQKKRPDIRVRPFLLVLLAGIEPASAPSEGAILSIERQELKSHDIALDTSVLPVTPVGLPIRTSSEMKSGANSAAFHFTRRCSR